MANHKSALKRIRQNKIRRDRNRATRSRVRTFTKGLRQTIEGGDEAEAQKQLTMATREYMKAAAKGTLNKKTASRHISRLAKAVNKMGVEAE